VSEHETIRSAIETAASHPGIASAVAATTSASGAIAILSQTQTILGVVSLAIGCVVGCFVIRCHYLRSKLLQREWDEGIKKKEEAHAN
jgi:hypothetical protein